MRLEQMTDGQTREEVIDDIRETLDRLENSDVEPRSRNSDVVALSPYQLALLSGFIWMLGLVAGVVSTSGGWGAFL